jgi:hypothetical protein
MAPQGSPGRDFAKWKRPVGKGQVRHDPVTWSTFGSHVHRNKSDCRALRGAGTGPWCLGVELSFGR